MSAVSLFTIELISSLACYHRYLMDAPNLPRLTVHFIWIQGVTAFFSVTAACDIQI